MIKNFSNFKLNEGLKNTVNVIIVSRNGILDTPQVISDNITADAAFQALAEELLGDDVSEINFFGEDALDRVNHLLEGQGIEINWSNMIDAV